MMIKWIIDIMDDPGAPGQGTLNIMMIKWILDIMDDPGAPGQCTLDIMMIKWKKYIMDDYGFFILKVPNMEQCMIFFLLYIYVFVFEFLRYVL